MSQLVVLQGGGAFTANDELDAQILRTHPGYVAVLPTADAFENPDELVQLSINWAKRLGATVKVCSVYTRADAREQSYADMVSQAGVVYVVGDSPIHLRSVLKDTVVFDALAAHPCVVAVAGSASALCDPMIDPRGGVDWEKGMDGINGTKHNRITPTTGTLVFFPSFMLHSVDTNRNSQPRISLTTDISTLSPSSIKYFSTLTKE